MIPVVRCVPRSDFVGGLKFYCKYCRCWHLHGRGEGHRISHCDDRNSPYYNGGYILKVVE